MTTYVKTFIIIINFKMYTIIVSKIQAMFFFAWVRNFVYKNLGKFGFLTFIIGFNFIIFLIQIFRHYINLHILIYATYLSKFNVFNKISVKYYNKKNSLLKLWY
jgi:hypothetical protein